MQEANLNDQRAVFVIFSISTEESISPPINMFQIRAVESESLKVKKSLKIEKNRIKSDKIGFDFLLDFLAKMPKCHKLP